MAALRSPPWLLRVGNLVCVTVYLVHLWVPIDMAVDIVILAGFLGYALALFSMFALRLLRTAKQGETKLRSHVALGAWCLVVGAALGSAIPVRAVLYRRAAEHGAVLVESVGRYESDTGSPPHDLQSLVPKYLSSIPGSGLRFCPDFTYGTSMNRGVRTWSIGLECALLYPPFAVLRYESWRASDPEYSSGWALGD